MSEGREWMSDFLTGLTGYFFATEGTEGRDSFEFLVFSFELGGNILVMFSSSGRCARMGGIIP